MALVNLRIPYADRADTGALTGESSFAPPLCCLEHWYNVLVKMLLYAAMFLIACIPFPVVADITARQFLGVTFMGVTEMETLGLVLIVFAAMPYVTATRSHIVIDMLFPLFRPRAQARLLLFSYAVCACIAGMLALRTASAAAETISITQALHLPESFFLGFCAFSLGLTALGMLWQVIHMCRRMTAGKDRDLAGMVVALAAVALMFCFPSLYKAWSLGLSRLALGSLGFLFLFVLLFLRVPIGLALSSIGVVGLLIIMRSPAAAWSLVAEVPFREVGNFVLVAIPMFMLMGEITSVSSISRDMFDCANKWLGRMPGGLACASVGGCAGFGAICGDSLTTVITMSAVALPQMRANRYSPALSTGALAAGGTLGILIPPSMGFVFYSIMTEESIGKLFVAGIAPGILLALIFIAIIIIQVKRDPALAPPTQTFSRTEKLRSLLGLLPMIGLFILVVGGILTGLFTPGEGGAVGALFAFLYAVARRRIRAEGLCRSLFNTALMTGKIFVIMVGVYVFGAFLATSRLPALLAAFVTGLQINRYLVLGIVILIYVLLGCVMNIIPMMLLTLPSIYPTIHALGFDGVWFGVIVVIVMEMGMITPPIGLNVFTMSSLAPDIPMTTVFKGVMPFFLGMCLCVLLVILFPQLALWLPSTL